MTTPVPFTQKRTVVIRAKVMESKRIYRDIEISSDSTLEDLGLFADSRGKLEFELSSD